VLLLIAVLGLAASCSKQPQVQFEHAGLERKVEARFKAVLSRPAVNAAVDAFVESLIAEPVVQTAGMAVFESFSADPKTADALGQLMEGIQTLPAMEAAVRDLMTQHPGASADEIGDRIGTQVSNALDTPQLGAVFDQLGDEMLRSVDLSPVTNAFASRIERAISRDDEARWSKRVIELNGGSVPPPARATDLYIDHVWSVSRIEKPVIALLANPTARRESAQLLAAALSIKEVADAVRSLVGQLVRDPAVRAQLLEAFSLCLATPRDDKAVAATARTILLSRPVLDAGRRMFTALLQSAEIGRRAGAMLDVLGADRAIRAELDALMNNW
jgi:hypothetical protein